MDGFKLLLRKNGRKIFGDGPFGENTPLVKIIKPIVVGPFPPPRHGVSSVNDLVFTMLEERGWAVLSINTAPPSLDRSLSMRLCRLGRVLVALLRLGRLSDSQAAVYFSLSGGYGLLYEALGVGLARLRGARIAVHHHSFRYLDAGFWPMALLVRVAGVSTLHVTLGRLMTGRLMQRYPRVEQTLTLSNAGLLASADAAPTFRQAAPLKVGLLSNLSAAKGLDDFIALAEVCQARGLPWKFVLAGPFENPADQIRVQPRLEALQNLDYRGPLFGGAKTEFFKEIDVFAFPTRYRNEAEPLVVLEALSQGVPVIAFTRGCIADMLSTTGGLFVRPGEDFVACALETLETWRAEGAAFTKRREAARQRFDTLREQSRAALPQLLEWMGVTTAN